MTTSTSAATFNLSKYAFIGLCAAQLAFVGCASKPKATEAASSPIVATPLDSTKTTPLKSDSVSLVGTYLDEEGRRVDVTGQYYIDDNGNIIGQKKTNTVLDALLAKQTIYFDFDSVNIGTADNAVLTAHANFIKTHPDSKVRLAGNTDQRGTREYNVALGERRAESVLSFMVFAGVNTNQLEVISYGKEKLASDENTEQGWAANRRVELQYLKGAPVTK